MAKSLVSSKARRWISVPAVMLACWLLLHLAWLWLPIALIYDYFTERSTARGIAFFAWLTLMETLGVIGLAIIWVASFVIPHEKFIELNFQLQTWWTKGVWQGAKWLFNVTLKVEGEEHTQPAPFILAPRHTSIADVLLPGILISAPTSTRLRYILKSELLWDPCLDIAGNRLPNVFVNRESGNTQKELEVIADGVRGCNTDHSFNEGIIIYPEGTRFSLGRQQKIRAKLREKFGDDHPDLKLNNVLPARPSGFFQIIDTLPEADVLFLAHNGFESFRNLEQLMNGSAVGTVCRCKFWRVPAAEIPTGEQRVQWLQQQWAQMDAEVSRLGKQ